ncbi:MAG TPA: hypothetical protein VM219_09065 [Phycisphaerae bacterium]|nr:hypothetical protein [Phycisphaerae bacterium]HUX02982.1 hypothetical protein [Phycisphaerae bacterium]
MARRYILITPADGGLWRLAKAVCRQGATEALDFAGLVKRLCEEEAGKAEVNVAQMSEVLADLRKLLAADPKAVLEVLAGKLEE